MAKLIFSTTRGQIHSNCWNSKYGKQCFSLGYSRSLLPRRGGKNGQKWNYHSKFECSLCQGWGYCSWRLVYKSKMKITLIFRSFTNKRYANQWPTRWIRLGAGLYLPSTRRWFDRCPAGPALCSKEPVKSSVNQNFSLIFDREKARCDCFCGIVMIGVIRLMLVFRMIVKTGSWLWEKTNCRDLGNIWNLR